MSSRNKGAIRERQRKEGRAISGRTPRGISRHSCSRRERSFRLFIISVTFTFFNILFPNILPHPRPANQFPIHHLKRASCCHIHRPGDLCESVDLGFSFAPQWLWCGGPQLSVRSQTSRSPGSCGNQSRGLVSLLVPFV